MLYVALGEVMGVPMHSNPAYEPLEIAHQSLTQGPGQTYQQYSVSALYNPWSPLHGGSAWWIETTTILLSLCAFVKRIKVKDFDHETCAHMYMIY